MLFSKREVKVTTPLGSALRFRRMTGKEELGRPFEYQLELVSPDEDLDFDKLLGHPVTVHLPLRHGSDRHFNGLVSRLSQAGRINRDVLYKVTLRPWLWFLSRTSNCRIFQEKTAVDIVKAVFRDHGFTDFDESLSGTFPTLEYCVQYRESDFNFVSRLLENEGIYYFFKHEDAKHTLVLADSYSAHEPVPGYEEISYLPPEEASKVREEDYLWSWDLSREVKPGAVALNDFDFKRPKAGLGVKSSIGRNHPRAEYEVYDYPGDYVTSSEGETYARARIEELQSQFEEASGEGNARGVLPGGLFTLSDFPRSDQNREYLVVAAEHEIHSQEYESTDNKEPGPDYRCSVKAIDSHTAFRPERLTRKPFVQGPQTAIVVGKSGEEIWTDKYGRVKVQFHWEREPKSNETSSCWVRVAQVWAGKQWGVVHTPRMGQEVIVDFLEGDPDRPIITGRVYNDDNMPPYALPDNATQSGIKSRSSKGGGPADFNEIRFEDKKGSEQVVVHAQKDLETTVENNEMREVGADRKTHIKANDTLDVDANETIHVKGSRTETVDAGETRTVNAGATETVNGSETRTINGGAKETINGSETRTVNGGTTETISGGETRTVNGAMTETINGALSQTISGGATITSPGAITITGQGGVTILAPGGTKIVDAELWKIGGHQGDAYSTLVTLVKQKADIATMALALTGTGIEVGMTKVALWNAVMDKKNTELTTASSVLKHAGVNMILAGMFGIL